MPMPLVAALLGILFVLSRPREALAVSPTDVGDGGGWGRYAVTVGVALGLHAVIATVALAALFSARGDLLATARFIGGLALITVAIVSVRRAPLPAPTLGPTQPLRPLGILLSRCRDLVQLSFVVSLLPHLIEDPTDTVAVGAGAALGLSVGASVALLLRAASPALVADGLWGTRLRQGAGSLFLIAAVYYAWP